MVYCLYEVWWNYVQQLLGVGTDRHTDTWHASFAYDITNGDVILETDRKQDSMSSLWTSPLGSVDVPLP
jgi:hypothetical protein